MLKKDKEYSFLRQHIEKEYGSIGNAATIWEINMGTLVAGMRRQKNGYKVAESLAKRLLETQESLEYQREEYERLARAYNALADKYTECQTLKEERIC